MNLIINSIIVVSSIVQVIDNFLVQTQYDGLLFDLESRRLPQSSKLRINFIVWGKHVSRRWERKKRISQAWISPSLSIVYKTIATLRSIKTKIDWLVKTLDCIKTSNLEAKKTFILLSQVLVEQRLFVIQPSKSQLQHENKSKLPS